MEKDKKSYASMKNPAIAAAAGKLYSFLSEDDAVEILQLFREKFFVSRPAEGEVTDPKRLKLWVNGYSLTKKEMEKGCMGNYAVFTVKPIGKKFTIEAEKFEADIKFHPMRKYQKQTHPNWGHPLMRLIKRGKKYSDVEKAAADLRSLQEQFPQVAIPAPNKLFIMVYGKDDNGKPGITKYVFEIKATEDCKFYIAYELNNHAKEKKEAKKAPVVAPTSPSAPQEAMGKFTSGVLLRRNKKRK